MSLNHPIVDSAYERFECYLSRWIDRIPYYSASRGWGVGNEVGGRVKG